MESNAIEVTNNQGNGYDRLNGFEVLVNGATCIADVRIAGAETKTVACSTPLTGTEVKIRNRAVRRRSVLHLCEVRRASSAG